MPGLVEQRDRRMGIDSARSREDRAECRSLAQPQSGVDDLKGAFARPTTAIEGVVDQAAVQGSSAPPASKSPH